MQRVEQVIETRQAAVDFCNMLNDIQVVGDMRLVDDGRKIVTACASRSSGELLLTDLRNMFACAYDRSHHHIGRDGCDAVFIHINNGQNLLAAAQRKRDYVLGPGMAGLYVNNAPISIELQSGADIMGVNLPRALTRGWAEAPEDVAVTARDPSHPALHMLKTYIRYMLYDDSAAALLTPETAAAMHVHIAELAGLWLCGLKPKNWHDENAQSRQVARYHAIHGRMRQHFATPGLSALAVGRALGLSERTVQQVLTQRGTSFSRLLGDTRAEKACQMLADPAHRHTPVTAIAFACGFNDLSAFYRAFKARYDEAPGAFRAN